MQLIDLASLFEKIPSYGGAVENYSQPVLGLEVPSLSPLYGLHLAIWQLRSGDLQEKFPLQTIDGCLGFLAWCVVHGRREYQALRELKPFWRTLNQPAVIPETEWSKGISRLLQLAIAGRPDLGINHALDNAQDQLSALKWFWFYGGYRELGQTAAQLPLWQKRFLFNGGSLEDSQFIKLFYSARLDISSKFDLSSEIGRNKLKKWILTNGPQETPLLDLIKPLPQAWPSDNKSGAGAALENGVNLIGYAFGELGIGEDVRMAAHAMYAAGVPFTIIDFAPGGNIRQHDRSAEQWVSNTPKYNINIICLTALEHLRLYVERGRELFDGRYTIGYWPWELQDWPANWKHCFNLVDEVWASSKHIQKAAEKVSSVPVHYMPMSVKLPRVSTIEPTRREHFGLPDNRVLFVFSFDGNSYIERKNPLAIVKAFQQAFPNKKEKVNLVIKCMRPDNSNSIWQKILELSKKDSRIIILDAMLSKADVMEFYRACDCFVSMHRAEGFGRGIAEALLLGLEVIATDYGGNTDFCRAAGAKLIPYRLKALGRNEYVEGEGQYWAEPDIQAAAQAMREVAQLRSSAKDKLSSDYQEKLNQLFSPEAVGKRYRQRIERITALQV